LEKVVFIHYKKGYGKPTGCNNDGVCQGWEDLSCADCIGGEDPEEPDTSSCHAFLDKWAKWKDLPQDLVIHPDLDNLTILNSASEWDAHTPTILFGTYSIDDSASWDSDAPDGRNDLVFGDYPQEGVIGVAIVWGYFSGPPSNRRIVEFDILFDTDFTWGDATVDPSVMDLQNIATHELGHAVGLGDLYDTVCAEETMYGYSDYGETKKRDLNDGDIAGIKSLY